ncbi:DNA-binding protein [Streptomyces sp. NBC_01102]|uniref:DNA-binding protein n=1 Tax=Streptomyces sp. NBC_01102 TaxID=2903749 RepID=UPI00386A06D0|nr:DNA-binding protein [Streptomyces sp. NBC_01102]
MPTSTPVTPLKPASQRFAQHLAEGLTTGEIVTRTGLSAHTIRQYVRDIRESIHCPPRCKPQVLVHFLLAAKQVTPPTTDWPTPELNAEQQLLLRAVAEHSSPREVALTAKIAPADVRSALADLLDATGAADVTQLVVLAHAWGLLGARAPGAMGSGVSQ